MTKKVGVFLLCLTTTATILIVSIPTTVGIERVSTGQIDPVQVKNEPSLNPALVRICSCESTGSPNNTPRQFNADGSVVRGKINQRDTGMCQINLDYHGAAATKMGIDLYTESGNIEYANWLYENEGTKPWFWSRQCWKKD